MTVQVNDWIQSIFPTWLMGLFDDKSSDPYHLYPASYQSFYILFFAFLFYYLFFCSEGGLVRVHTTKL